MRYGKAQGRLIKLCGRVFGPKNNVDTIKLFQSSRAHTLDGNMTPLKMVLQCKDNTIPKWFLETIGVYVSKINNYQCWIDHYLTGLKKLLKKEDLFQKIELNLTFVSFCKIFDNKFKKALNYIEILAKDPKAISKVHIQSLREVGFTDEVILEINQLTICFNCAVRIVLGLGISIENNIFGLYPNNS